MTGEIDIGGGVILAPMFGTDAGRGFYWRHTGCRAWFIVWLDERTTGHRIVSGTLGDLSTITIAGSLLCPKGCGKHGTIEYGRWKE